MTTPPQRPQLSQVSVSQVRGAVQSVLFVDFGVGKVNLAVCIGISLPPSRRPKIDVRQRCGTPQQYQQKRKVQSRLTLAFG